MRVYDVVALVAEGLKNDLQGLDGGSSHRDVIAHAVHIAALPTEVDLHVDSQQPEVFRVQ